MGNPVHNEYGVLAYADGDSVTDTGIVNVKDYGAIGNGIADDTDAINTALSALPATGGIVLLPSFEYKFSDTIILKTLQSLVGQGYGTHLKYYGDGAAIAIEANGSTNPAVSTSGAYRVNLKDFRLTDYGTGTKGIQYSAVVFGMVQGVQVVDFDVGIEIAGNMAESCYMCTFLDCWSNNTVCYHLKSYNASYPPNNNQIIGGHIGCQGLNSIGIKQESGSQLMVLHVTAEASASCSDGPHFILNTGGDYCTYIANRFESAGAEAVCEFGASSNDNVFLFNILSNTDVTDAGERNSIHRFDTQTWTLPVVPSFVADAYFTTANRGIIVKTPDGTHYYRINVDNSGTVQSTLIS